MDAETQGRDAATRFRQDHHLGVQPLGDLVSIIEQATGIDVAILDAPPDEHGMAVRDPVCGAVFIGVARTRNPMRQRSTLAHELGHVLFEDWVENGANSPSGRPVERRADTFARHLLVPSEGLREFVGESESTTLSTLSAVVQRYLISPAIAAIAMHDAGFIDPTIKEEWKALSTPELAARFGWSDQYHALQAAADQRRAPQRLLARAIRAYAEGVLAAQAIATLRGITLEAAETDLRQAGVVPPAQRQIAWADAAELPDMQVDLAALDADLNASDS